jgi:hypothetical protein
MIDVVRKPPKLWAGGIFFSIPIRELVPGLKAKGRAMNRRERLAELERIVRSRNPLVKRELWKRIYHALLEVELSTNDAAPGISDEERFVDFVELYGKEEDFVESRMRRNHG